MAIDNQQDEKRERFQWLWRIYDVYKKDDDNTEKVPMQVGDRLFLFFISDTEVCFHRRPEKGFENDRAWNETRGTYCPESKEIKGSITDDAGQTTEYTITLEIDSSGRGKITGEHSYNPTAGGWHGNDD